MDKDETLQKLVSNEEKTSSKKLCEKFESNELESISNSVNPPKLKKQTELPRIHIPDSDDEDKDNNISINIPPSPVFLDDIEDLISPIKPKKSKLFGMQSSTPLREPFSRKNRTKKFQSPLIQRADENGEHDFKPLEADYNFRLTYAIATPYESHLNKKSIVEFVDYQTPGMVSTANLTKLGLNINVINMTFESASNFVFPNNKLISDIVSEFQSMRGIDSSQATNDWCLSHLKEIILKLASYERSFPHTFPPSSSLNFENVLLQLQHRYDREIIKSHKSPVLRLNQKESLNCSIIVYVAAKYGHSVLISDGWHTIEAQLDTILKSMIRKGRINVGTKLIIKTNEISKNGQIKIHGNSSRRVRWHCRLGYVAPNDEFIVALDAISPCGGRVSRIKIRILR